MRVITVAAWTTDYAWEPLRYRCPRLTAAIAATLRLDAHPDALHRDRWRLSRPASHVAGAGRWLVCVGQGDRNSPVTFVGPPFRGNRTLDRWFLSASYRRWTGLSSRNVRTRGRPGPHGARPGRRSHPPAKRIRWTASGQSPREGKCPMFHRESIGDAARAVFVWVYPCARRSSVRRFIRPTLAGLRAPQCQAYADSSFTQARFST